MWFKYGMKAQKLLAQGNGHKQHALLWAHFLTLIMFNEPWILSDVVYVIEFTFFHEGEYDS